MRPLTYLIGVTLDGFIAGPDDEVDFFDLSDDFVDYLGEQWADTLPSHVRTALGVADRPLTRFDTVVMGRRTYDPAATLGIDDPYAHLRTVVCSRTLTARPELPVEFTADDPVAVVRRLKAAGSGLGVYLAGGGRLAGQVLDEIDHLVVKTYPVLAGSGVPVIAGGFGPRRFALDGQRRFGNDCVVAEFHRRR